MNTTYRYFFAECVEQMVIDTAPQWITDPAKQIYPGVTLRNGLGLTFRVSAVFPDGFADLNALRAGKASGEYTRVKVARLHSNYDWILV